MAKALSKPGIQCCEGLSVGDGLGKELGVIIGDGVGEDVGVCVGVGVSVGAKVDVVGIGVAIGINEEGGDSEGVVSGAPDSYGLSFITV